MTTNRDYALDVINAAVRWTAVSAERRWDDSDEANELRKKTVEYLEWINGGTLVLEQDGTQWREKLGREHEYGPHSSGGK